MVSENLIQWLANGERGVSSKAIVHYVAGLDMGKNSRPDHPYDPDDLTRCIRLLERCPELVSGFREKMPKVSETWARLVENWDELVSMFDAEAPGWRDGANWSAPKTYEAMRKIRGLQ